VSGRAINEHFVFRRISQSEEFIDPPWALATARIRLCETFNPRACRCQQQHTKPPHVN
jgi:hypothetical protein